MTLDRDAILGAEPEGNAVLDQIEALEAQLRVSLLQVKALKAALVDAMDEPAPCPHPPSQRQYLAGTMGSKRQYDCGVCTARITEE